MNDIFIPTLLFWENGNSWYGSKGAARFYVQPVKGEGEAAPALSAELWRGPLTRELSQILATASFSLSEAGLEALTAWLEARASELNA